MRVISGTARNKPLLSVEGLDTRPTIDRVKEGIFSSIQFIIPGATVLDLFSGTGQMGIEALSRGAKFGVFVDHAPKAIEVTTKNLKNCGLFDKARVVNMVSQDFLRTTKDKFDIVFLDPPYNLGILDEILPKVCEILSEDGIIFAESELGWKPADIEGLKLKKQYKYGKVLVSKFQKESEE
ncbi:MAG: 16S rRNA (guanine(966)-N(2))-methyltransferase RsmD [Oscillospiraceae bacterium]|nr:16S rRNA (guanine(966)-N(2))-methyltransferase RsmD [Oscillospiraceae bacterium]